MAKRVFFSFDYEDVSDFRANVVRQHALTKYDRNAAGFFDASIWEAARKTGDTALKRLINTGLDGTSVTCVLIGSNTFARRWVRYEILKSFERGNSLLGVHINSIRGKDQQTKPKGPNPFEYVGATFSRTGITVTLWQVDGGVWKEYIEIEGKASYQVEPPVAAKLRDKGFNLGNFYPVYDWVGDDGYNNFAAWVG